jgi:hypothetical protein
MATKLKIEKRGDEILIFYQNMPNLHNRYISAERKISQKNPQYTGPFQNCVRQLRPVSKMAAVAKNRNFFKWPKLLYFKPECAQI